MYFIGFEKKGNLPEHPTKCKKIQKTHDVTPLYIDIYDYIDGFTFLTDMWFPDDIRQTNNILSGYISPIQIHYSKKIGFRESN